ncbi:SoxR reducing system RseC family protein [Thiothrix nivea]|nr:SoxR reducing system RseC family protein [Thiothrix nivea]
MSSEHDPDVIKFQSSFLAYDSPKNLINRATRMIEQTALVVSVEAGQAWVVPQQGSAAGGCAACASKNSCSSSSVLGFLRREPQKMWAMNPVYARPGDTVIVGMPGNTLVTYSLFAYLLPLIALILAAMLGQKAFALLGLPSELGAVFAGVAGLIGGLRLANRVVARSFSSSDSLPVILRVSGQTNFSQILPLA